MRLVCAKYSFMCLFRAGASFTTVSSAQIKLMTQLNELKNSADFKSMRIRKKKDTNRLFSRMVLTLSSFKDEMKAKKFTEVYKKVL